MGCSIPCGVVRGLNLTCGWGCGISCGVGFDLDFCMKWNARCGVQCGMTFSVWCGNVRYVCVRLCVWNDTTCSVDRV